MSTFWKQIVCGPTWKLKGDGPLVSLLSPAVEGYKSRIDDPSSLGLGKTSGVDMGPLDPFAGHLWKLKGSLIEVVLWSRVDVDGSHGCWNKQKISPFV